MPAHTNLNEETVDLVARSLHRHHDQRRLGQWPSKWREYDALDTACREEFRDRAAEVVMAVQGTDTLDEAANVLASLWGGEPGTLAHATYTEYAHARITETLKDVPTLKETK